MSLPEFSIRHKPIVISVVLLSMAWGVVAFFTMPRREDPEFTIRICVVSTSWPGAPATKVEELITDKIEQKLSSIEEVETVRSTTLSGKSTVFVELEDWVPAGDIKQVWDKVRARVELVKMPDKNIRPVVNDEFGDTSVLVLAVHQTPVHGRKSIRKQDEYSLRELEQFADEVRDAIRILPGVAKVDLFGVRDEAVYIETDLGNWSQLDLTTAQLESLAVNRNIIEPGGEINTQEGHFSISPGGEFNSIDEIERIASVVRSGDSENSVYLSELGLTVTRGYEDPPTYICRYGNTAFSTPAVAIGITMKSGSNIIDVCESATERVRKLIEIEQLLPPDVSVTAVSDQSKNVAAKIQDVVVNVFQAVLIVVAVVFIVVGLRTSLVMAANIPVVVIASLGLVSMLGVQLEQISLAALIISLGLLVDNAVQVCDQARTNQILGMKPFRAAIEGANTLAIPMLVGTLTTIAAFLPMLIALEGGGKEYIYSMPVTVSMTLALSWILAMTFCVVLAGIFIRAPKSNQSGSPLTATINVFVRLISRFRKTPSQHPKTETHENMFFRLYDVFGGFAIRWKWVTVAIAFGMLAVVMQLPVSSEFFPGGESDQFAVKIVLPETATIQQTDEIAKQVEAVLRKLSDSVDSLGNSENRLRAMRTLVGGGGSRWHLAWSPEAPASNYAEILVRTTSGLLTSGFMHDLRRACEFGDDERGIQPIVGARIVPIQLSMGPPADPLVFRVIGNGFAEIAQLRKIKNEIKQLVLSQPETWDVSDSWGIDGFQVQVDVDEDKATLAGITNSQVAKTLSSYYTGLKLTTFREGDHLIPIYFRLRPEERQSVQGLRETFVEGSKGKIPLNSIAEFGFRWEPAKIERRDMNRTIEVSSEMEPGVSGNDVVKRILDSSEMKSIVANLPVGFRIEPGGSYAESADASKQMLTSFGISFLLIVLCLVVQYNGWAKPMIILGTLPLALTGAWLGLHLTGNALGFMPQLGILALFGIVLNTAIIFIEFADIVIAQKSELSNGQGPIFGLERKEFRDCLIEAGKQRMLPIFLTTATTVGGLLPLALSGGALWEGLAWAMIFGLLVATVLTLFVVPAFYAILVESFHISPLPTKFESE